MFNIIILSFLKKVHVRHDMDYPTLLKVRYLFHFKVLYRKKNCSITILVCLCHRCHHNHNYFLLHMKLLFYVKSYKKKLSKYISRVSFGSHSKKYNMKVIQTIHSLSHEHNIAYQYSEHLSCFIKKNYDFNLKNQD